MFFCNKWLNVLVFSYERRARRILVYDIEVDRKQSFSNKNGIDSDIFKPQAEF